MRFEIPFDKEIFRSQNKLWFDYVWSKNIAKNRKGFYFGIPFLLLGTLIVYSKNELGFLFIGSGLFLIITAYRYYNHYNQRNKIFFDSIESTIKKYEKHQLAGIFEFNENDFFYKDYRFEVKINWIAFTGFIRIEDNLFMFFDKERQMPYIIGKKEVSNQDFDKIIQFLNNKKLVSK